MFQTVKQAEAVVGSLSSPGKMPGHGYSIPAQKCLVGSQLRNVEGSTCSKCYAMKNRYSFKATKNALHKRYESLRNPLWIEAIVTLIRKQEKSGYFRWFDSGDLQGVWHLANICEVCNRLPDIQFWLPTREYAIVREYLVDHKLPKNLTVRLSTYMVDDKTSERATAKVAKKLGVQMSSVRKTEFTCPAPKQNNQCGECRKCWGRRSFNVSYRLH